MECSHTTIRTQGATTGIEAYNKTLEDMIKGTDSGINKILAAYNYIPISPRILIIRRARK